MKHRNLGSDSPNPSKRKAAYNEEPQLAVILTLKDRAETGRSLKHGVLLELISFSLTERPFLTM